MNLSVKKQTILTVLKRTGIVCGCLVILFFILHLLFPLPGHIEYSTILTDNKGAVINAFLTSDEKWRMKTTLDEISPLLRKTIIAKEDKYFYTHPGVNLAAVIRALYYNITKQRRTSGASTITMQVARALERRERTIFAKAIEAFRALQLELKYSKDEILQLYLNLVPYGGNIEGVKAASLLYFKKNPDHLSLAEITALSIIPNRPSSLVIGRDNDRIITERNKWLQKFADEKIFTQKEIEDALAEPLVAKRGAVPHYIPHLAYKLKKAGSETIRTNIDLNIQLRTEKLVADYIRTQRMQQIRNAAVVIIDNRTRKVISYVGSADFNDSTDGGQVNGAAAIRQPGSTLKPLLYALCFDEGLLTPRTVMTDIPVNYQGYAPENYDQRFNGYVTVEKALELSLNIPAVKALKLLTPETLIGELSAVNFKQVKKDRNKLGLSMILGGCGASLEELTGLFSSFAQEGKYVRPAYLQNDTIKQAAQLISPAAAYMINEILSKVNRPDFPLNWTATEHMPKIAWKTGTSYGRRDAWSIGYNKNFTVGVWAGNFSGLGIASLSGANTATPLLFKIFNVLDYDSDVAWFSIPSDCDSRVVCSETGMLPADRCQNIVTDYFIPMVSSTKNCNNEQEVMISADEKISYCRSCVPEAGYKKRFYKITDPGMKGWMEENHIAYEKIPPHYEGCEMVFKENAPAITFPQNGMEYLVNKKNPEPLQLISKTATDVSKVYWYINNRFYKSANAGDKQFFIPEEGPVKISCTDDKGRNRDIRIYVKYVDL